VQRGRVIYGATPPTPRWPWSLAALWVTVVVLIGVPAVLIGAPIAHDVINAGKGASTPREALVRWVYTFEDATRNGELMAERMAVASRREQLEKQRREYLATRTTDMQRHPQAVPSRFELADVPPDATEPAQQTITGGYRHRDHVLARHMDCRQ